MEKIRVLLITRECLRYDSNEGNVLLNLFAGLPVELSNLYCKPGLPESNACSRSFQLTDRMALDNVIHCTPMGRQVTDQADEDDEESSAETENKSFYDFFRLHNWNSFHLARDFLWAVANYKNLDLKDFLRESAPQVIFAPMCYSLFVLDVQRFVIRETGCPAMTYIWDDIYSLRQVEFSPFFWLQRFLLRAAIRKNIPLYQHIYTMAEQQARGYRALLHTPIQVMPKCVAMRAGKYCPHEEVRFIYAGNVGLGRDKTLEKVAQELRQLYRKGVKVKLDIYTNSPLKPGTYRKLNDGKVSFVHEVVSEEMLRECYTQSDVALHVESFSTRYALRVRLSFSTKIVDCLASGCAVLAICPPKNAGWQYLHDEKAALCVDAPERIGKAIQSLVREPEKRQALAAAAQRCLQRNHDPAQIKQLLWQDLTHLAAGQEASQKNK